MTDGASRGVGAEAMALIEELYPICRSITGNGVRQTLEVLARHAPLTVSEVPSGTDVLDWTVPREWNIKDAWIKNAAGERVVDFRASNLHVVSYSVPVRGRFSLAELRPRLHSLPQQPDLIPYRTSYYDEAWGFCLTHRTLSSLPEAEYEVCIDSTLEPGSLTYGEVVLPGSSSDEILVSSHICHPSLCDDNLSGVATALLLARELAALPTRRYTLRFLFAPGTIGAITWLARNRQTAARIKHGLTLTCLGDAQQFTLKRTFDGNAEIDRALASVLRSSGLPHQSIDFFPYGYDERQYNSPGFRLPVASLMRGRHGQFPEYHTSADDPSFVSAERLAESYSILRGTLELLEHNRYYVNQQPYAEPQLGRRGLYRAVGGTTIAGLQFAMLWVLNMSDGKHSLLDVVERSGLGFREVRAAAELLLEHRLLAEKEAS
jgi:aminopeptidase-like protein